MKIFAAKTKTVVTHWHDIIIVRVLTVLIAVLLRNLLGVLIWRIEIIILNRRFLIVDWVIFIGIIFMVVSYFFLLIVSTLTWNFLLVVFICTSWLLIFIYVSGRTILITWILLGVVLFVIFFCIPQRMLGDRFFVIIPLLNSMRMPWHVV